MPEQRNRQYWRDYLASRTGTYEYRTRRYAAVADELERLGLADGDLIVDVGAGMCEFGRYMYANRGWHGQYLPVDGSIDGVNIDSVSNRCWSAPCHADFFVAIEVIEHLHQPLELLWHIIGFATKGVVVTTPNTDRLGHAAVMAMDATHVHPIYQSDLSGRWPESTDHRIHIMELFGTPEDTIVASWRK